MIILQSAQQVVRRLGPDAWATTSTFAVTLDSRVIGSITLWIDKDQEAASLGYGLARVHWGKGFIPEAAKAVVDWGFKEHELARVYAIADLRHQRSWRVMEKLGMTREGVLRSHRRVKEERRDEVYYGILRHEWENAG